jgi:16S rRNA (uracil1498-N3)-methyltransferase
MREDRFFIEEKIELGGLIILRKELFHQIKNVLRKKPGENIILFNGTGIEARAKIEYLSKDKVGVSILDITKPDREAKIYVSLFCSILKKENFELVVQKATEIGVRNIFPMICKNTVKKGLNFNRLEKIIKEAAEQSGRVFLPKIENILRFKEAIEKSKNFDLKVLFDISGSGANIDQNKFQNISVFVGPEGGWSEEEIKLAKKENFKIVNLGKLNLRAETAAIVGVFKFINFGLEN